jgi:hypothetical protein
MTTNPARDAGAMAPRGVSAVGAGNLGIWEAGRQSIRVYGRHIEDDGPTVFKHACTLGLEGIVSKQKDLLYRSGRSRNWLKESGVCGDDAGGGGGLGPTIEGKNQIMIYGSACPMGCSCRTVWAGG